MLSAENGIRNEKRAAVRNPFGWFVAIQNLARGLVLRRALAALAFGIGAAGAVSPI